jgi:hypothetical protein
MRWLVLSVPLILGCEWAWAHGFRATGLVFGAAAAGCVVLYLRPGPAPEQVAAGPGTRRSRGGRRTARG